MPGEARPVEAREEERMQEDARLELVWLQAAMLEAEVEVEEVVEEQQLKKKRFKSNPVTKLQAILENEDAIVEWAATHPELYDRGHSDYYFKEAKDRAYADKATMYPDLTGKQLEKWLTGMRDRYFKVSNEFKQKSGAGDAKITARNQYIKEKFAFLKPYISRHKGTTAGLGETVEEPPVDEGSDEGSTPGIPLGPTPPRTEADPAELSLEVLARPSTSDRIGKGTKGKKSVKDEYFVVTCDEAYQRNLNEKRRKEEQEQNKQERKRAREMKKMTKVTKKIKLENSSALK